MSEDVITKGGQTRQAIIEAAHALFIEQGYHGTSMRQIARRAGLVVGGLYNHFGSKEEIYSQVLLEYHPYRQIIPILQAPGRYAGRAGDECLAPVRCRAGQTPGLHETDLYRAE
jgi:AcrR family transcriptional regulator